MVGPISTGVCNFSIVDSNNDRQIEKNTMLYIYINMYMHTYIYHLTDITICFYINFCLKTLHWSDVIASSDKSTIHTEVSETERKRREAVWELLRSECVFLIDHCMVLKHVSAT